MNYKNSPFWTFAKGKAKRVAGNASRLGAILTSASRKAEENKSRLAGVFKDLKNLLQLLSAWARGEYRAAPWSSILAALAAVIYFLNPLDILPDVIAGAGLVDDAFVLSAVFSSIKNDLKKFNDWKKEQDNTVVIS